jgi:hypothetical protein
VHSPVTDMTNDNINVNIKMTHHMRMQIANERKQHPHPFPECNMCGFCQYIPAPTRLEIGISQQGGPQIALGAPLCVTCVCADPCQVTISIVCLILQWLIFRVDSSTTLCYFSIRLLKGIFLSYEDDAPMIGMIISL